MLKSFFKKDEPTKTSRPPTAVNHSQAHPQGEESGGGGFFNLPPPVAKGSNPSQAYSNPNIAPSYNHSPSMAQGQPIFHQGSQQPQAAYPPGLNPSTPYQQQQRTQQPAPSLFGGMSVKTIVTEQTPTIAQEGKPKSLFGGLELGGSIAAGNHELPVQAPPPGKKKAGGQRSSQTFNYLDVAKQQTSSGVNDPAPAVTSPSSARRRSNPTSVISKPPNSGPIKKKKPTFRPGFGRQYSEETIAALQNGDIRESDLHGAPQNASEAPEVAAPAKSARSSSSVLSGLTVHTAEPEKSSTGGGLLSGLTVQRAPAAYVMPRIVE
jgi:hypothetical protein